MRKRILAILTILTLLAFASCAFADNKKFDGEKYGLKGKLEVWSEMKGNINGDKYDDTVRLVVLPSDVAAQRAERMWFEVQPGYPENTYEPNRPAPYIVPLPEGLTAYAPHTELAAFAPGGIDEVFLTFNSTYGGGPRHFAVIRLRANDLHRDALFLFDSRTMNRAIASGGYLGRYLANIRVVDTNTNVTFDVSARKSFYEKEGVYGADGSILKPVSIIVEKYEDITIGEKDASGVDMLTATMGIFGYSEDDRLATAKCTLKYDHAFDSWRVIGTNIIPESDIKIVK